MSTTLTGLRPAGATVTLPHPTDPDATKTYRFPALTLLDLREIQDFLDRTENPLARAMRAIEALPEEHRGPAIERAIEQAGDLTKLSGPVVGEPEGARALMRPAGAAFVLTLMLKRGQPGIADEEVRYVCSSLDEKQIEQLFERSTGVSEDGGPKGEGRPAAASG